MRLKRLLLRYHPPGIGLECITDNESGENRDCQSQSQTSSSEVIHKDLPEVDQISTLKQVVALVEQVLQEENELLNRKRHGSSLLQLLGRLYNVDTDGEKLPPLGKSEPPGPGLISDDPVQQQQQATKSGIGSRSQSGQTSLAPLNHKSSYTKKYENTINSNNLTNLNQNLPDLNHNQNLSSINQNSTQSQGSTSRFENGTKVIAIGFSGSNACYNGLIGRITKVIVEKKTKYEVTLDGPSGQESSETNETNTVVKLKENHILRVLNDGKPFPNTIHNDTNSSQNTIVIPSGCRIVITSLKNHAILNGTVARVVEYNQNQNRYEVRMIETGQLFRVKPDNILPALEPGEDPPIELIRKLEEVRRRKLGEQQQQSQQLNQTVGQYFDNEYNQSDDPYSQVNLKLSNNPDTKGLLLIPVGASVIMQNLRSSDWLNGQRAQVLSVDHDRKRYEIRLDSDGSVKKIKADNVAEEMGGKFGTTVDEMGGTASGGHRVAEEMGGNASGNNQNHDNNNDITIIPKNTRIELINLKSASHMNGERALILLYDKESDRYNIRLEHDGSTRQVKKDNVKVIAAP